MKAEPTTKALIEMLYDRHSAIFHRPKREWVGLTDEEKKSFWTADQMTQEEWDELFNAVEAKLKEKNA